MLGEVLLEEVVGEAVDVEHRAIGEIGGRRLVAHQGRRDLAFAVGVGAQRQFELLVAVSEDVRTPSSHYHTLGVFADHRSWVHNEVK